MARYATILLVLARPVSTMSSSMVRRCLGERISTIAAPPQPPHYRKIRPALYLATPKCPFLPIAPCRFSAYSQHHDSSTPISRMHAYQKRMRSKKKGKLHHTEASGFVIPDNQGQKRIHSAKAFLKQFLRQKRHVAAF